MLFEGLRDIAVYKIIYSPVDEKPEIARKLLKKMVGAKGFEPSTSWSRTRRASQAALRPESYSILPISLRGIAGLRNRRMAIPFYLARFTSPSQENRLPCCARTSATLYAIPH